MEIKKESINFVEKNVKMNSNVMLEGDVVVPDINPDIQEILLADAIATAQSWEYRNGKLHISGVVDIKVLYRPDEGEDTAELKSLDTSFPFTDTIDISSGEGLRYLVLAHTEHIGFALVNSRKLSIKVIASVEVNGYKDRTIEPVMSVEGGDIECREKQYNLYIPVSDNQSEITVSDLLIVPENMPDIDEILKVDAWCSSDECKIMNGKVMVKGEVHIKTLYTSVAEDNKTCMVSHEIPFVEIVESENTDEDCAVSVFYTIKNILAQARGDINGDTKIINAEVVLSARVKSSKSEQKVFADDCYSTTANMKKELEQFSFYEYVDADNAELTQTQNIKMPKNVKLGDVISVSCKPIVREISFADEHLHVRGSLVSFLMYRENGENGKVKSAVTETDFAYKTRAIGDDLTAEVDVWTGEVTASKLSGDEAEVKIVVRVFAKVLKNCKANIIIDCERFETDKDKSDKPSVVIYFVEDGDTLWNIAKKYGTTVDKIKKANGLEGDMLIPGDGILIPKAS